MSHHIDDLQGDWNYPTSIRFGIGRIGELAGVCIDLGIKRPLLVTDDNLAGLDLVTDVISAVETAGLPIGLFSDVRPNPSSDDVTAGVKAYLAEGHDGVIAFGGGSALDTGKAIALMVSQTRPLWDFEDAGDNWRRVNANGIAPVVAVPTTAGTGSEVGRAAVIVDASIPIKKIIFHPKMLPRVVIADPALTVGLPPKVTAATGMDALAHNLEAFCAPGYHPMADGIALEGMRLVKEWLPSAFHEPGNLVARSHMMAASSMGATAFQKGLGGMHAMVHPLGAIYGIHHGLLIAVLMPYVLVANRPAIGEHMMRLARYLGLTACSFDAVLRWILDLRREIGIPDNLKDLGVGTERLEDVGRMAVQDPSAGGNPIAFGAEDYTRICASAVQGRWDE